MAQTIKILRSSSTALTDGSSALDFGVLAITDIASVRRFYMGDSSNVAREIGGDAFAKLASPAFTGSPTAPTQTQGDNSTKLATTAYVDTAVAAITVQYDYKDSVRVATDSNTTISAPGATIDGVTMSNGDRFLLFGQTSGEENGIYEFNGAASAATRTTDADTSTEVTNGMTIANTGEGTYAGSRFVLTTADPIVLDTTSLTFSEQPNQGLTAGDGIDITAGAIIVDVTDLVGTGIEDDGSNNFRLAAQGNGIAGGAGSTLSVQADSTGGANLATVVNVSANGVAVKIDNSSIVENGSNQLEVALVDAGTF